PAEKTQDSELGPSAAAANIGNIQESSPLVKVDPSSNSGNEQQVEPEESQQAESQEHCDSSGKQEKNQPRKRNVVEVKNLSSSPENSQGSPQQIHSKQKPLIEGGSGQERVPPPLHPPKFFRPRVPNNYVPFWLGPRRN
ncbi:mCG1031356, partial [Mus musculus]